jgi:predicted Zn-dependent peptidase
MTFFRSLPILFACAAFALAQKAPVKSYKDIQYPPLRNVKPPEPTRVELRNGLIVYLLEDHELPTISMQALIRTGSRYEPAAKAGLAAITGSVIRTGGTATRSGNDLDNVLDRLGATIETGIGVDSGSAIVSVLKEDIDRALPILSDLIRNPAFPQDKIDLAKNELRDSISRRNESSNAILYREAAKIIYGKDSPYTRHPEYSTVDSITRNDLVAFHKQYFQPENIILGVWGDFQSADMRAKIEKEFGSWARGGNPKPEVPAVDAAAASRSGIYVINKEDVNQSEVALIGLGGKRNDPDFYAGTVSTEVLGGGFGSRLVNSVRTDQGLAYSTGSAWRAEYDHPGLRMATAGTKSQSTIQAVNSIKKELQRIGDVEPTDAEFRRAKDYLLKGAAFDFDSTDKIVSRLLTYEYNGYPRDYLKEYAKNIDSVTKASAVSFAKQYWDPSKQAILIVGKVKDFDQPPSSLGQVTTIDITIPKPPTSQVSEATPQSLASGKALLAKARAAMGGDKLALVKDFTQKGTLAAVTPQGEFSLKVETTVLTSGKSIQKMTTPGGEIIQGFDGSNAWVKTPRGVQDAPGDASTSAKEEFFRELVILLNRANQLTAQDLGQSDLGGKKVEGILVTDPATKNQVKLFIDPQTGLLAGRNYTAALMGPAAEVQELILGYKEAQGVQFPVHLVLNSNGAKRAEVTIDDVQVNTGVPDSVFVKPQL